MPDYTRSRWFTEPHPGGQWVIWDEAGVASIALVRTGVLPDSSGEANARLIAAAPDLLEAARAALRWIARNIPMVSSSDPVFGSDRVRELLREAIAKADGIVSPVKPSD